ncbi:MAG: penicillin acylase family protein, partial [Rubrobacter sp.]|nr:penicillin acylase family protein [Rubrobacter sp.]
TTEPRSPELRLLRHRPEPWTPADTAVWALVMAWGLSASWESKLLYKSTGEEGLNGLLGYIGPDVGSNAWAASPERSASGSTMLAGDPHLLLGAPCPWYEIGLYGGPYHVVGASLPGAPGVVIGHNETIAWSITAALTDVQDLYVERFEEGDASLYKYRGEWRKAVLREEKILVRGRKPVVQRVRTTLHGPVITDLLGGNEDVALRWAAPEPFKLVEAGLAINRACDKEEFLDALRSWMAPNQNFVYADRMGTVGWALAGTVPIRNNHQGERPVSGWDGEYEWKGFVPFEELPKRFDPEAGFVASANEAPEASSDAVPIPGIYPPGYRKDRIEQLLRTSSKHTLETFRAIQGDLYCAPVHALAVRLATLDPPTGVPEGLSRELAAWDGQLTAESRPGAVARIALGVLLQRAAGTILRIDSPVSVGADIHLTRLLPKLAARFDNLPDEALRGALQEAIEILTESCGANVANWSWGALHMVELRHPLGIMRALRSLLNRGPYPAGGDANTVQLAAFRSVRSDGSGRLSFGPATTGPNYRFVVDTGDWRRAWSIVAPGQSGHPVSMNYDDQLGLWQKIRYRPMVFGRETAELATRHRLVLEPNA